MDGMLISQDDFFCLGDFTLSLRDRSLNRSDEKVFLRPKAFEVLLLLVQNRGRIVSKEKLLDTVWSDVEVTEASLSHTIHELRQFLGDSPTHPRYIQTVPRVGYRLADWAVEPVSGRVRPVRATSSRVNGLLLPLLALISMVGLASWGHWSVPGREPISEPVGAPAVNSVGLILPKVEVTSADPRIAELAHTVYNLILARINERTSGIALFSPTPLSSPAEFEALVGRMEDVSELQMSLLAWGPPPSSASGDGTR